MSLTPITRVMSNPRWALVWEPEPPPPPALASGRLGNSGGRGSAVPLIDGTICAGPPAPTLDQGAESVHVTPPSVVERSLPSLLSSQPCTASAKLSCRTPADDTVTFELCLPPSGTFPKPIPCEFLRIGTKAIESAMSNGIIVPTVAFPASTKSSCRNHVLPPSSVA